MTDDLDDLTQDAILKAVTDLVNKIDKGKENKEQTKALNTMGSCLQEIKIKLNVVQTEQKAFHEARRDRSENCDKIHNDFEQRLRSTPLPDRCKINEKRFAALEGQVGEITEKRVEKIEVQIGKITPFMYKVAGASILGAIVITPIIGAVVTYIMKKIGG